MISTRTRTPCRRSVAVSSLVVLRGGDGGGVPATTGWYIRMAGAMNIIFDSSPAPLDTAQDPGRR
eukprot:COSAG01_NODE_1021_length_12074_cov_7.519876_4_plen_65_part_00